jgi:hypothetical protein
MKYVTTKSAIVSQYGDRIISVPYCALQSLLRYTEATAYTSGVNGWNCDIYDVNGVALVTGYRPFGKPVDRELVNHFEKRAREELEAEYPRSWKLLKSALHNLLVQFVKESMW